MYTCTVEIRGNFKSLLHNIKQLKHSVYLIINQSKQGVPKPLKRLTDQGFIFN